MRPYIYNTFLLEGGNMDYLITFVFCFTIIYFVYFVIIINRKQGLEKFKTGKQIEFFKTVYKLDFRKINVKKFANSLALTNSFIMAFTITILELVDGIAIKLLLGFIILIPLMLLMYKILGNYYQNGGKKNV